MFILPSVLYIDNTVKYFTIIKKGTREYELWFLKYNPSEHNVKQDTKYLEKTQSEHLNLKDNGFITKRLTQSKTRKIIKRLKKTRKFKQNKIDKSSSFLF